MRKIVLILLCCLAGVLAEAQSNIRLTDYWDNTFYINPAAIDEKNLLDISMAARKQWLGFDGSPTTFFVAGAIFNNDLNTQFGLKAVQDQIGYTSTTNIDLSYAYSMTVYFNWKLNLGLAATYQSFGYDISKVNFPTADDPSIYSRLASQDNFNAQLGAELVNKNWRFGLSGQNIFSLFSTSSISKFYTNTNFLYGMYRDYSHDFMNMGYGACAIQYANTLQMEFNVNSYFKLSNSNNPFQIGFFYRTWSEMGLLFGVNLSKNLKVSYSYDYDVGGISRSSFGTHELMISYSFERVWRCKNCWY